MACGFGSALPMAYCCWHCSDGYHCRSCWVAFSNGCLYFVTFITKGNQSVADFWSRNVWIGSCHTTQSSTRVFASGFRGVNDVSNLGMCHLIRAMCGVGDFVIPTVNVSLGIQTFTLGWCKQLASLQSCTPWNGLCMMGFSRCHISNRGLARNSSRCSIIFPHEDERGSMCIVHNINDKLQRWCLNCQWTLTKAGVRRNCT